MTRVVADLRSDTVTRPTAAMRAAMAAAVVGDDVFGDDPTANALQERAAALLGKEAALLVPTGTMANLCAVLSHCGRGDEVLAGAASHTYRWEAGGSAVLGGVMLQPIAHQPDGTLALADIQAEIKPDDPHFPRTRLLCLENTFGGRVMPLPWLDAAAGLARQNGLATHLDGARLFNAAVASGASVARIAAGFDTVSVCFSKGLGAPAGSVLAGPRPVIAQARRWRKMLGGGLRQAGVLGAAALHALDHHIERLADDHARARRLAAGLAGLPGVRVEPVETNMVWVGLDASRAEGIASRLAARGVLCTGGTRLRLVTHLDVDDHAVDNAVAILRDTL